MNITTFPLGQMQANCYLLEQDGKCILVDPGDTADFLLEQVSRRNVELVGLVATHGHFDHIMAVGEIQLSYPNLPLYIHPKDQFLITRIVETANHFLGYDPAVVPIGKTQKIMPGTLHISGFEFDIIHTPGHTPGSVCLHFPEEKVLFTGDTLFAGGIGRSDFSYSDKDDLKRSIEKILALPEETAFYSGHGEEGMIEYEKDIISAYF